MSTHFVKRIVRLFYNDSPETGMFKIMDRGMVIEILHMDNVTADRGCVSNRLIAFGSFHIHSFCPSI